MEDSVTYQAIVQSAAERAMRIGIQQGVQQGLQQGLQQGVQQGRQEGREEGREEGRRQEALRILRRLGTRAFGAIPPEVDAQLQAMTDADQLDSLIERVLVISSWPELFSVPQSLET